MKTLRIWRTAFYPMLAVIFLAGLPFTSPPAGQPAAASATPGTPASAPGDWEITAKSAAEIRQVYQLKNSPTGTVFGLAYSPDGRTLAASGPGGVVLLDGETLQLQRELDARGRFSQLSFSADGRRLAATDPVSHLTQVWDLETGDTAALIENTGTIAAVSPDGKTLAAVEDEPTFDASGAPGPMKTTLKLFKIDSGQQTGTAAASSALSVWNDTLPDTIGLYFSADSKTLQTVSRLGDVRLWNAVNGQALNASVNSYTRGRLSGGSCWTDGSNGSLFSVGCHISYLDPPCVENTPGCQPVVRGRDEHGLWDANRLGRLRNLVLQDQNGELFGAVLDAANKEIGLLRDDQLEFWDFGKPQKPGRAFAGAEIAAWSNYLMTCPRCVRPLLAVNPASGSQKQLAVAIPGQIMLWDSTANKMLQRYEYDPRQVSGAAPGLSGSKTMLAAGFSDGSIAVLDPAANRSETDIAGAHTGEAWQVFLAADGKTMLSAGADGTVKWWKPGTTAPLRSQAANTTQILLLNPSANLLVAGIMERDKNQYVVNKQLVIQNAQTGEKKHTLDDWARQAALSLDGRWLAGAQSEKINLWNVEKGSLIRTFTLPDPSDSLKTLALNPNGSLIAGAQSGSFYVQDVNTLQVVVSGKLDVNVKSMDFSPSGCLLVLGDALGGINLLDLQAKKVISQWHAHSGAVKQIRFSQDGRTLLSVGEDGAARLWGKPGVLAQPAGRQPAQTCQLAAPPMTSTPPTPSVTPAPPTPTATSAPAVHTRTLQLTDPRMTGNDVLQMQQRLSALGYTQVGIPDGVFGPKTDQAVRAFQERNGLVIDGQVGPITWKKLFSSSAVRP